MFQTPQLGRLDCNHGSQRQEACHPAVGQCRRQADLRHHAALELRRRDAVRARAHLDPLPAHPRRARRARGGRVDGGRRRVQGIAETALSLARLGGAGRTEADGAPGGRHPGRDVRLRPHRAAAAPARARRAAQRDVAPEGHQPDHESRRAHAHRHRAQLPRRDRPRARHRRRVGRHDPRLHPVAGLRGPAAQDGREGQRRRAVLHAARDHPGDGAGRRPAARRDRLRPGLRHRRLPGAVV